ncbi:MAG: PilZ domain-containing protein [SAR324 cluster bacterium]|nr:PilZ domain-containing protein [SAR324 cluster bacterium]
MNLPIFTFLDKAAHYNIYLDRIYEKFLTQQTTQNFLKSYQDYQRTSMDSKVYSVLIFVLVAFIIGVTGIVLIRYLSKGKISRQVGDIHDNTATLLKNLATQKLHALKASAAQINVFFEMLKNDSDYIEVIENPNVFEEYLNYFKMVEENPGKLRLAESLRDVFNFNFSNLNVEFSHTRMLPVRQKIRVFLYRGFKTADYLSAVVRNQQDFFSILPPKVKGAWVRIDDLKELEIRVSRKDDSEYQFYCPLMWQSDDQVPQIILQHTDNITKITTRFYKRYLIEIPCKIARFSKNNLKSSEKISVTTKDFSQGGMCLVIPKAVIISHDELLEITIPSTQVKTLFARIVAHNLLDNSENAYLNIEFTGITEVERLLIGRYIKSLLPIEQIGS